MASNCSCVGTFLMGFCGFFHFVLTPAKGESATIRSPTAISKSCFKKPQYLLYVVFLSRDSCCASHTFKCDGLISDTLRSISCGQLFLKILTMEAFVALVLVGFP